MPYRPWSAAEQAEDAADELLVVLHVVGEEPELLEIGNVDGPEGLTRAQASEGDRLEARTAGLGPLRDEDEIELGPLAAREQEDRAVAPLVLHGDVLLDGGTVLDLHEVLALVAFGQALGDAEVGGV